MLAARAGSGIFSMQSFPSRMIGGQGSGLSPSHTPEKSGLPSAVRGGGALALRAPVEPRGTPGIGYLHHCVAASRGASSITQTRRAARIRMCAIIAHYNKAESTNRREHRALGDA